MTCDYLPIRRSHDVVLLIWEIFDLFWNELGFLYLEFIGLGMIVQNTTLVMTKSS